MPEGDTIHHTAARLRAVLAGRVPEEILTPHPRHAAAHWAQRLQGRPVRAVDAHGKHLLLRFDGALTLHSHLRMTGAWHLYRSGQRWTRGPHRAWLLLRCAGWDVVQFDGPLLELIPDSRTRTDPRLSTLGQDILGEPFDAAHFLTRLRNDDPRRPIGDALLDQRIVAGIGNVWKSETCFAVGIDPWRTLAAVPDEQALELIHFARRHMSRSARDGPSARPHAVHGRAGLPCPRCATPIRQRAQGEGGRVTYWCPRCQG